nr:unnamed protein product [Spirometra erinaceieuropaei]
MASGDPQRNVLIPIDASPNCLRAFEWYKTHLKKPGDLVFFVHVIEPVYTTPAVGLAMESPPLLVDDMTRVMEESISSGKKLGHKYMQLAKDIGLDCKAFLHVDTKPGNAIVKSAADHKADFIVIGSRGLGAIKRTFLGSQRLQELQDLWINRKVVEIQDSSGRNEVKNFFASMKSACGPTAKAIAPLLSPD